jgi:hypothetical protein
LLLAAMEVQILVVVERVALPIQVMITLEMVDLV